MFFFEPYLRRGRRREEKVLAAEEKEGRNPRRRGHTCRGFIALDFRVFTASTTLSLSDALLTERGESNGIRGGRTNGERAAREKGKGMGEGEGGSQPTSRQRTEKK